MMQTTQSRERKPVRDQFYYDILESLSQPRKSISPKYFYDRKGSAYFDEICTLEEYYPYRAELALLPRVAHSVARLLPDRCALIEFGAGSLNKVRPLLKAMPNIHRFIPIDICGEHLHGACVSLAREFQQLKVEPHIADFTQPTRLACNACEQRLGFFPGSTIGNLDPEQARAFLLNVRPVIGSGGHMLIGVDTKKSPEILHKAYNDRDGVTARFNLNVLERIGQHFETSVPINEFEHYAFYNAPEGRVEMHLVCNKPLSLVLDGVVIDFGQGETIHTENSYKYSVTEFADLAASAGWKMVQHWLAPDDMFAIYLLKHDAALMNDAA